MIILRDNNVGQLESERSFKTEAIEDLFPIANKSIAELCKEDNVLVFPQSLMECEDSIGNSTIINILPQTKDTVHILTNNIIGFIGRGNVKLKIQSRFDTSNSNDYFLHYMLQKVLSFNLVDLSHSSQDDNVFDFLLFLFPRFLKAAMQQGVFREYKRIEHNESNIKGAVDIARYIKYDVPFLGKVAYNSREYCFDNYMTELIRHTIEFMRTSSLGNEVLNMDKDTIKCVDEIIMMTPSYQSGKRQSVIQNNLRPKVHPYFTEYRPLQKLCIQILRHDEVKYGESNKDIYGILFDGAWLWEEYINTLLSPHGFLHPQNKLNKGAIFLFEDLKDDGRLLRSGRRFPDFYKDSIIIDAKYKRFGGYDKVASVPRDDIHQVIAYMHQKKAQLGAFISPAIEKQHSTPISNLVGYGGKMAVLCLSIPQCCNSYEDFCSQIQNDERKLIFSINETLKNNVDISAHAESI